MVWTNEYYLFMDFFLFASIYYCKTSEDYAYAIMCKLLVVLVHHKCTRPLSMRKPYNSQTKYIDIELKLPTVVETYSINTFVPM